MVSTGTFGRPIDGGDTLNIIESTTRQGNPGDPADSAFRRIWAKIRPHFERAIANDQNK